MQMVQVALIFNTLQNILLVKLGININSKSFGYWSHGITCSFLCELKCSGNNCCLIMCQFSTFSSLIKINHGVINVIACNEKEDRQKDV